MKEETAWMTTVQAAQRLNCSPRRVRQLLSGGELKGLQRGPRSRWRLQAAEVDKYLLELERPYATAPDLEGEEINVVVMATVTGIKRQTMADALLGTGNPGDLVVWVHLLLQATGLVRPNVIGLDFGREKIPASVLPMDFLISPKNKSFDVSFSVALQVVKGNRSPRVFVGEGGHQWFSSPVVLEIL